MSGVQQNSHLRWERPWRIVPLRVLQGPDAHREPLPAHGPLQRHGRHIAPIVRWRRGGRKMIRYACPRCRILLESPDLMEGRRDTCPVCGFSHVVPEKPIRYRCTRCGATLESPTESSGKRELCPACGKLLKVPMTEAQKAEERRREAERRELETLRKRQAAARQSREKSERQHRASPTRRRADRRTHEVKRPVIKHQNHGLAISQAQHTPVVSGPGQSIPAVSPRMLRLAHELKADLDHLSELGVNLDKAAAIAKEPRRNNLIDYARGRMV